VACRLVGTGTAGWRGGILAVIAAPPGCPQANGAGLAGEALIAQLAPQLGGVVAALPPAPLQVLFGAVDQLRAGRLAPGRRLAGPQPAFHGLVAQAKLAGDALERQSSLPQAGNLVIACLAVIKPVASAFLRLGQGLRLRNGE